MEQEQPQEYQQNIEISQIEAKDEDLQSQKFQNNDLVEDLEKEQTMDSNKIFDQINKKTLKQLEQARKQSEIDSQLMANRISLLKQEELKSMKKVEETRQKTMNIYNQRVQNEKFKKILAKSSMNKLSHLPAIQIKIQNQKIANEQRRQQIMKEQIEFNQLRAQQIKTQNQFFQQKQQKIVEQIRENKRQRVLHIKDVESQIKYKIQDIQEQKQLLYKNEIMKKIKEQAYLKNFNDQGRIQMENLEQILIQKLQASQNLQLNAQQQLERALSLPPKEFASVYLNKKLKLKKIPKEKKNTSKSIQQSLIELDQQDEYEQF